MCVVYDIPLQELRLFSDYGRPSRPLFVVEKLKLLIRKVWEVRGSVFLRSRGEFSPNLPLPSPSQEHIYKIMQKEETGYGWSDLVAEGLVEFVDTEVRRGHLMR